MNISFAAAGRTGLSWPFIAALFAVPICLSIYAVSGLDNIPANTTAYGAANIGAGWGLIETRYFSVYCEEGVDLNAVSRRLRKRIFLYGQGPSYDEGVEKNVAYRLDAIFVRARETLDMYPQMPRIKIKIFSDEETLYREYRKIMGGSGTTKAFYVHFYRTIFTSEDTINDSVMAHEIAHAIIDHYYKYIPSPKVSEALASYIDMHISD